MAKPLSAETIELLGRVDELTPTEIYTLSVLGLVQISEDGSALVKSNKANRALKRANKAADLQAVKAIVFEALKTVGKSADHHFRLDDVLKQTGLNKSENRQLILDSLRAFREEGLTETVKFSDNNFQIFWKVTPEFLEFIQE